MTERVIDSGAVGGVAFGGSEALLSNVVDPRLFLRLRCGRRHGLAIPLDRPLQTLFKRYRRFIPEMLCSKRDIGQRVPDISEPFRSVFRRTRIIRQLLQSFEDLVECHPNARCGVKCHASNLLRWSSTSSQV